MARVTVEDCILKVPNRFNLVMYASQRARDISSGAAETVDRDNDKNPVIALREIAEDTLSFDELQESLILGLQKQQPSDDLEEDLEVAEALSRESIVLGATPVDGGVADRQAANTAVADAGMADGGIAAAGIPDAEIAGGGGTEAGDTEAGDTDTGDADLGDAGTTQDVAAGEAVADTGVLLGAEVRNPEEKEEPEG